MRRWLLFGGLTLLLLLGWLATTDNIRIWPVRNTLQYQLLHWWWEQAGFPGTSGGQGTLAGTLRDPAGQPIAGASVLVSAWDGTTWQGRSDSAGRYRIVGIAAGRYVPVAGAPGYADVALRAWGQGLTIADNLERQLDIVLEPLEQPELAPGSQLRIGEPQQLRCEQPISSTALRRSVSFLSGERPNQPTFFYTPISGTHQLPVVLAVYPGPADGWECASLPLTQAGYAVLAVGPAYALDLEPDIQELTRLLGFVRAGAFARADPQRIAVVAGSYSGLHVLQLLRRGVPLEAALLLGPPTDIFDMRRRLEDRTFVPPYGLDQALIALGLPDRAPERYWRYSGAYHVAADWPPLALLHSRDDDVVPFQQSELLAEQLTVAGVRHQTLFFDGAQHYLLGDPAQIGTVYSYTLAFLAAELR